MGNRFLIDYLDEISLVEDFGYSYVLPIVPQGHAVQAANQPNAVFPSVQIVLTRPSVSSPISDQSGTENSSMWVSRALGPGQRMGLLGLGKATSVNVEHCNGARALCLKWPQGKGDPSPFSVAYSGDCRPSSAFAKAARGATVLIHEATFDDELKGEAKAKKHSTVQEAVGVASLMRAKSLVLTHFSQRYQKIPVLDHVWEKTDDLEREIEREERDLDVHGRAAKGLGAGQDVDEIAPDLDEATGTTTDPQNLEPMEKMDEDNDGEAETEAEVGAKETPLKILFAFDYMRVRVGEIPKLQAYRPALMKLFENEIEESEAKRLKKSLSLADMTPFNGGVGLGGTKMAKQKPGNTPGGPKRHGSVKKGQENGKAKKRKSVGSAEAARAAIDKTGAGKNSDALDGLADGIHEMV
jgi:ribonuclease Z